MSNDVDEDLITPRMCLEDRVMTLERDVDELKHAFNNLVKMAVKNGRESQVGTRGASRCQESDSRHFQHLCVWGYNGPTLDDCKICLGEQ